MRLLVFSLIKTTSFAGAKWFAQRKLLTPAFHFKILESFMSVFTEKANLLVQDLEPKIEGDYFDVLPMITNTTLDVICGKIHFEWIA